MRCVSRQYRSAPEIVTLYAANIPPTAIRAKIRQRFEQNKYVDDLQAVDILLAKSYMDYQETLNAWKMDSHLMRMFNDEEVFIQLRNQSIMMFADYFPVMAIVVYPTLAFWNSFDRLHRGQVCSS
jgi:hypothetical protein